MNAKGLTLLLPAVLALGLAAGCSKHEEAAPKAAAAPAEYLAKVGNSYITQGDLDEFMRARAEGQPGAEQNPAVALQELVNVSVLEQEAVKQGIDQRPDIQQQLTRARTNLLINTLLREHMQQIQITDEELKAEYDAQVAHMGTKEYKARHILVDSEEKAKEIIAQLDNKADFAKLAEENSTGPSASRGGDLGWFSPGTMVPPFASAVESLKKGEYTKTPVQTQFGWHVILLEDVRESQPPAFDDVKDQLRNILTNKNVQAYVVELRNAAQVEVKEPQAAAPEAAPAKTE